MFHDGKEDVSNEPAGAGSRAMRCTCVPITHTTYIAGGSAVCHARAQDSRGRLRLRAPPGAGGAAPLMCVLVLEAQRPSCVRSPPARRGDPHSALQARTHLAHLHQQLRRHGDHDHTPGCTRSLHLSLTPPEGAARSPGRQSASTAGVIFEQVVFEEQGPLGISMSMNSDNSTEIEKAPKPGSMAEKLGLQAGDVIVAVGTHATTGMDPNQIVPLIKAEGRPLLMEVARKGGGSTGCSNGGLTGSRDRGAGPSQQQPAGGMLWGLQGESGECEPAISVACY